MTAATAAGNDTRMSRQLARDYIRHRITHGGDRRRVALQNGSVSSDTTPDLSRTSSVSSNNDLEVDGEPQSDAVNRVYSALRLLGEEFETRYEEVFQETCNSLHVTRDTARNTFQLVVNDLFQGGIINWGRIVALYAFGGALASQCVEKEMPMLVDQIVEWITFYTDTQLMSWIQQNGGWEGLVEFQLRGRDQRNGTNWPSIRTLCGYAVGAIGVLTLGAILSQK